jgi:aminoglycoside 3-N-acetyltransferase
MRVKKIISNTQLPHTIESLKKDFKNLGIEPGMVIIVHSSLSSIGWVCGGAFSVILALQETLTKEGTIIMPAHSSDLSDPKDWKKPSVPEDWWQAIRDNLPAFDPKATPTFGIGIIPEIFRNCRGVLRSYHPTASFAAWGKKADKIIEKHSLKHGFGEKSPLNKIYSLNGQILLIGVGHESNTSIHLGEEKCRSYPQEKVSAPITNEKGLREWKSFKQAAYNIEFFKIIGDEFEKKHLFQFGKVGNSEAKLFNQKEFVNFSVQWFSDFLNKVKKF